VAGLGVALVILIIGRPIELYLEKVFPIKHGEARPSDAEGPGDFDG
jgi:hypothetical protein